jgi:hypothetical protein
LNADFQNIKGARQKKESNAAEFIGQQPKYSITGLTPRSAVILRRHLGDPAAKYVWRTLLQSINRLKTKDRRAGTEGTVKRSMKENEKQMPLT